MDDNGNELEITDDMKFRLTPKGFFMHQFTEFGASSEQAMERWHRFEAFCIKRLGPKSEGTFPCLVFDGEGGDVFSAEVSD